MGPIPCAGQDKLASLNESMLSLPLLSINPLVVAGTGLWAIALYLGFYPLSQWVVEQISRGFSLAERFLHPSAKEFKAHSSQAAENAFWPSILSILPFLALGTLCYYGLVISLGQSWAISLGLIACIGGGVYELGRRDGQASD